MFSSIKLINIDIFKRKELIRILELKNICFNRDNKDILKNINLKLDTDKFVVITGPNGSRKIYSCKNNNGNRKAR